MKYGRFLWKAKVKPLISHYADEEIKEDEEIDQEEVEVNGIEEKTVLIPKLTPKEIENYVNSLKAAAVHWYNTHNPINNTDLSKNESL